MKLFTFTLAAAAILPQFNNSCFNCLYSQQTSFYCQQKKLCVSSQADVLLSCPTDAIISNYLNCTTPKPLCLQQAQPLISPAADVIMINKGNGTNTYSINANEVCSILIANVQLSSDGRPFYPAN